VRLADSTAATKDTETMDLTSFLPILFLLLLVPIFLSGRKQRAQMAQTQKMQAELSDGDVVVTTCGLRGTIVDTSYEETLDIEIAPGVVTTWLRAAVREKVDPNAGAAADTTEGTTAADSAADTPADDSSGGRPTT
jgi:preprotein translocase subunit YajC